MNAVIAQWIGKRESQEDAYAVKHFPTGLLSVLCDGMGGHQFGALASRTAVRVFVEAFEQETSGPISERLSIALHAANDAVGELFKQYEAFGGTTLTAVFVGGGVMWWISVGDSPLYLWRCGRLLRLNADHSLREVYMQYVKAGTITFEDAANKGHTLRSALTGEDIAMIDAPPTPYPLLPGDRIILSSDGSDDLFFVAILSEKVRALLSNREGNLATGIIEACVALESPYADNVTVVCMDWQPSPGHP